MSPAAAIPKEKSKRDSYGFVGEISKELIETIHKEISKGPPKENIEEILEKRNPKGIARGV